MTAPKRLGKQQIAILKVLQAEEKNGLMQFEIIGKVSPIPREPTLFGGSFAEPVAENKIMASISRSLRLLKRAGYVKKEVWQIPDKHMPCGHITIREWVITVEGLNLLKVKSRDLTFTGASM